MSITRTVNVIDNNTPTIHVETNKSLAKKDDSVLITATFNEPVQNVTIKMEGSNQVSTTSMQQSNQDSLKYLFDHSVKGNGDCGNYRCRRSSFKSSCPKTNYF